MVKRSAFRRILPLLSIPVSQTFSGKEQVEFCYCLGGGAVSLRCSVSKFRTAVEGRTASGVVEELEGVTS